jgi:hypothetical protein
MLMLMLMLIIMLVMMASASRMVTVLQMSAPQRSKRSSLVAPMCLHKQQQ